MLTIVWHAMETKCLLSGEAKHTYICMTTTKDITTGIVLKMISAPMWPLGKSKKIFDNDLKPAILYV